jgi:isopenicillin N synthase-like dioxygenase
MFDKVLKSLRKCATLPMGRNSKIVYIFAQHHSSHSTLTMTAVSETTDGLNGGDSASTRSLPIICLAQWLDASDSEKERIAARVCKICHEIGFFLLQDHGIHPQFLRDVFSIMRRLFSLPLHQKKLIDKHKSRHFRGWECEGSEKTNGRPDYREQVDLWTEHPARDANVEPKYLRLLGPNQWFPNEQDVLPGYREIMTEWFQQAEKVADTILEILAVGLGLEANHFETNVFGLERMSLTKIIRYPPTPDNQAGVNAHHDTGFITVLCCETSPGLQVQNEAGEWFDVTPPTPYTFVINLGEMLQGMTQNYFVATPHRVVNTQSIERFALGYFHGPSLSTKLSPLHLDESYVAAVKASRRHSHAGFMASKQETEQGVGDMQSTHRPDVYGEQLYNYFARSYPNIMAVHYPDDTTTTS